MRVPIGAYCALLIAILGTGCRSVWREPPYAPLLLLSQARPQPRPAVNQHGYALRPVLSTPAALQSAQEFSQSAARAELSGSTQSTDNHFHAALAAWTALHELPAGTDDYQLAWETYHTSLARLLATASSAGRFLPGQGLVVQSSQGLTFVPIAVRGGVWRNEDAQVIHPTGSYRQKALSRQYRAEGWGVPVVVERRLATATRVEEQFLTPGAMFAATAILRPCAAGGAVLELIDSLHPDPAALQDLQPLANDLSAPFALRLHTSPELQSDWLSFFGVDLPTSEGLFFLEPYQQGKIPVVMVHGILSNPTSWVDMANDLRATPGFANRFQLWAFRYPTGAPFLESASRLRHDLSRAASIADPAGQDPALRQMILIGHSMGGLVCELQAANSQDRLWNAVANRPFSAIVATPAARRALQDMFFFEPQPNVRCVISLAAPHRGSNWADRPIGRLGAALASPDPERVARHEQLMSLNPGVFSEEVTARVPTSIDMLDPDSAILAAIAALPKSPCVDVHTIFGYGRTRLTSGQGDGIVSVDSALSPHATSQIGIDASHTNIHRKVEAVDEIVRILDERLTRFMVGQTASQVPIAATHDAACQAK